MKRDFEQIRREIQRLSDAGWKLTATSGWKAPKGTVIFSRREAIAMLDMQTKITQLKDQSV